MKKFFEILKYIKAQFNTQTERTVARLLSNFSLTISTAESCTGGLLSSRLTDIAGSSSYTSENYITYANNVKTKILGVPENIIENFGVVSEECALAMANGLFVKTNCDIAISTTGVAGPTTPEKGKSVGTAYIGIKSKIGEAVKKVEVDPHNSRKMIKFLFTQHALEFLIEFLNKNYVETTQQLSVPTDPDNP